MYIYICMYIHVLFSFFRKVAEAVAVCDRMGLLWPTEYTTTYIMTTLFSAQGCEKGRSLDFYDEKNSSDRNSLAKAVIE